MNVRPHHPRPRRIHAARAPGIDMPALNAMRTAERAFAAAASPADLLATAADALATQPGQTCLVSLVDGEVLRPVGVAHVLSSSAAELRGVIQDVEAACADAFSRAAQLRCAALRMRIGNPSLLQLWLPDAYLDYAARKRISAVLAAPLAIRGRVLGTFLLWREGEHAPPYTASDQAYVAGLAGRLALALQAYRASGAPDVQAGDEHGRLQGADGTRA
jgi:GAF domain-containing protein